jgi:cysteine desulfurase
MARRVTNFSFIEFWKVQFSHRGGGFLSPAFLKLKKIMDLNNIYLDNAATTPVDPQVLETMLPYLSGQYGNPSAANAPGRIARLAVETARRKIADILNCKPRCIFFTSGGTESANTAIRSVTAGEKINNIITSRTEHACVLQTVRNLQCKEQALLNYVKLDEAGCVQLTNLDHLLYKSHSRSLVALMHANNEMGAPLNLELSTDICKRYKAVFFSDTVQTVGHYPIDLSLNAPDMISASAHKFHGPKGVGFLYMREGLSVPPLLTGGSQESGFRAGTENVASVVGMAKALEIASERYADDVMHIRFLKKAMHEILLSLGAVINGPDNDDSLYTVLNARFPKNEATENLLLELDMAGVAVSGGSACSAGKGGSHVMEAIGTADHVNIRFSFSRFNTLDEILKTGALIEELLLNENIKK